MPLVIPEANVNIHWLFTLTGDAEPMSFAIGAAVDITGFDYQTIANDAYVAFSGGYGLPNMYDQWTFLGTRVEVEDGLAAETIIPAAGTGGAAGTLPQNVSMIVKKLTGTPGRRGRGRCYPPPFSFAEVDINNVGMIDPTVLATIQSNWDGFITALEASESLDPPLVLLHNDEPTPVPDPTPITSFQVEGQVATQRRRLR